MDSGGGGGEVGEVPHVLADDGLAAVETGWFVSRYSSGIRRSRASGYYRVQGRHRFGADGVADDVDPAGSSGAAGTPTFFVGGRRQYGAYDIDTLTAAVKKARLSRGLDVPYRRDQVDDKHADAAVLPESCFGRSPRGASARSAKSCGPA
jgi:hypothetical protein